MNKSPPDDGAARLSALAPEVASTVVRVAGDIALVIDETGVIRNVADGSLPLGRAEHTWVGRPWADTVSAPARAKVELLLNEALQHGVSRRRELNHPGVEGTEIPVSWAAVRLGQGGPLLAVGRDLRAISAIQQRFLEAQQTLERDYWQRRNTESHYRLLFQVAHDAVLVLDADTGLVLDANPAAGQLFDQLAPRWDGLTLRPYIEEGLRPALDELLVTACTTGHAAEVRLRAAGSGLPLDVSATPFQAEAQRCLLLRARRAAPAETAPPRPAIGDTADAVVVTDTSGRVLWVNAAFLALSQVQTEVHAKGRLLAELLGDSQQQWATLMARVRARGVVGHATVTLRTPDGSTSAVDLSAALMAEGDQEHIGFTLQPRPTPAPRGALNSLLLDLSGQAARLGQAPLQDLVAEATRRVETHFVEAALHAAGGHIDIAARTLHLSNQALVQRMQELGLPLPAPSGHQGLPPRVN